MKPRPLSLRITLALAVACSVAGSCKNPVAPPPPDPPPVVEAPSITCPSNLTVGVTQGTVVVNYPQPSVLGGTQPVSVSCTIPSGTSLPVGSSDVVCTASDAIGRRAQCVFNVNVTNTARLKGTRFLAFGDSITWGEVAQPFALRFFRFYDPVNNYPAVLQGLLRDRFPSQASEIIVTNSGVQGERVVDSEDRLVSDITRLSPDVLLLLHGTNDVNSSTSPFTIVQSLRADVRRALQRGVKLVLLSTLLPQVPGRFRAYNPDGIVATNEVIRSVAAQEGAVLVDMFAVLAPQKEKLIGDDGLHPTVEGYRLMAETFAAAIRANFEAPPLGTVGGSPGSAGALGVRKPW